MAKPEPTLTKHLMARFFKVELLVVTTNVGNTGTKSLAYFAEG
jgi:hypothetical protein